MALLGSTLFQLGSAQAPERLIKLPEVAKRIGLGKTMIYRMIKEGNFPRAYKVNGAATRWSEHEVAAWIMEVKSPRLERQ